MSENQQTNPHRLNLTEFRERGYLQELNRRFLHPLGLALEVIVDDETGEVKSLGGIWDYRSDPEGLMFVDSLLETDEARKRADFVASEIERRRKTREQLFSGTTIQPIPGWPPYPIES